MSIDIRALAEPVFREASSLVLLQLMQKKGWTPYILGQMIGWQNEDWGETISEWLESSQRSAVECAAVLRATAAMEVGTSLGKVKMMSITAEEPDAGGMDDPLLTLLAVINQQSGADMLRALAGLETFIAPALVGRQRTVADLLSSRLSSSPAIAPSTPKLDLFQIPHDVTWQQERLFAAFLDGLREVAVRKHELPPGFREGLEELLKALKAMPDAPGG